MQKYSNRDFYLSAFLMAIGYKLIDHYKTNRITTFIFEDSENLQKDIAEYMAMKASVEPMSYGMAQRALKSVIHSTDANSKDNNNVKQTRKGD